jgi:hypothetical protein
MKRLLIAGVALACLALGACATLPARQTVSIEIDAATADAAAVKFEVAVAVFADTLAFAVADPNTTLDPQKLGAQVSEARIYLVRGRNAFDARTGDVTQLATQALDVVSAGLPPVAPTKVRTALLGARLAVGLYGATVGVRASAPVEPSEALVSARKSADAAVNRLLKTLPPPGGT